MKYDIRGKDIKITKSIEEYIKTKIDKLEKYFNEPEGITINVLAKVKGKAQTIEITIYTDNFTIRAEDCNEDLYAAVDGVEQKLERQIVKCKQKLIKINREKVKEFMLSYDAEVIEEENKIVKRKRIETKPIDEEEAMLQMEMLGHDFFIYRDIETKEIRVMYKRKDGQLGLIEIE